MSAPILETVAITEIEAPLYHLSIRLCAGGFICFIERRDSLEVPLSKERKEPFRRFIPYIKSDSRTWVERFYENPFLSYPYSGVSVSYHPLSFVLTPALVSASDEVEWWLLTAPLRVSPKDVHVQLCELGAGLPFVVSGWDREMYDFFMRTYPGADYTPSIHSLISKAVSLSRIEESCTLALEVWEHSVDIVVTNMGEVVFANAFEWPACSDAHQHLDEILYFVARVRTFVHSRIAEKEKRSLIIEDGEQGSSEITLTVVEELKKRL